MVSPNPAAPGSNITVSAMTTAPSAIVPRTTPPILPPLHGPEALLALAVLLAGVAWTIHGSRKVGTSQRRTVFLPLAVGFLLALALAGCGGGYGGSRTAGHPQALTARR